MKTVDQEVAKRLITIKNETEKYEKLIHLEEKVKTVLGYNKKIASVKRSIEQMNSEIDRISVLSLKNTIKKKEDAVRLLKSANFSIGIVEAWNDDATNIDKQMSFISNSDLLKIYISRVALYSREIPVKLKKIDESLEEAKDMVEGFLEEGKDVLFDELMHAKNGKDLSLSLYLLRILSHSLIGFS